MAIPGPSAIPAPVPQATTTSSDEGDTISNSSPSSPEDDSVHDINDIYRSAMIDRNTFHYTV
jgi:hypothetical protein